MGTIFVFSRKRLGEKIEDLVKLVIPVFNLFFHTPVL